MDAQVTRSWLLQVPRELLSQHLNAAVQHHLQLLAASYSRLSLFVHTLSSPLPDQLRNKGAHLSWPPSPDARKLGADALFTGDAAQLHSSGSSSDCSGISKPAGHVIGKLKPEASSVSHVPVADFLLTGSETLARKNEAKLSDSYLFPPSEGAIGDSSYTSNRDLERTIDEQRSYISLLHQKLYENETKVVHLSEKLDSLRNQLCGGVYLWRVAHFSNLINESTRGKVVHSPGFYTSSYGYRVCLRMNVQSRENTGFLSIFIHLMQGEFDDFLQWPFIGTITLTIVDQSDDVEKKHISETMTSKPGLDAFKRPVGERNPKGFGYVEFVSLEMLSERSYVKDDTLFIKACVSSA